MTFYIMNKDIKVLEFNLKDWKSTSNSMNITNIYNYDLVPLPLQAYDSIQRWIDSRFVLSNRHRMSALTALLNLNSLKDKILYSHCVSLLDTYWVKSSDECLQWSDINPYSNRFNDLVSLFSLSGKVHNVETSTCCPEFSTSGSYPNCWGREHGGIYFYKAGSNGARNSGKEPYSELLASDLADFLGFTHVKYKPSNYRGITVTKCLNMCSEDIGIYSVAEVFPDVHSYVDLLKMFEYDIDNIRQLVQTFLLDYLTLNVDRHLGNISIFVDNKYQYLLGVTPIYDNNMSLLPFYTDIWYKDVKSYLAENEVYRYTKLNQTFDDLLATLLQIDEQYVRNMLWKASNFMFDSGTERDGVANKVLEIQLNNAKNIV